MCKFSSKSGGGVPFQPLGDLTHKETDHGCQTGGGGGANPLNFGGEG